MDFTQESNPESPAILVENVFKRYRGRRGVEALRGVSLSIQPGEIFGLLGRNGAGKTTLVKILLDIVRPTQGQTFLLGQSSRSAATRRPVGYLPEDHRFPEYRTGESTMHFYAISDLTSSEGQHRITTVPGADAQILEALASVASNVSTNDGVLELTLPRTEDIDKVVDLLRAKGISIRSIEAKKNTLEQVFLEAVDSANGSRGGEAR